ncbi:MAG: hypothetical protein HY880_09540, partial [Deltaproteobacteria bacterium]|nr:hypothetical protein [Deltaproteobacteria bacterium]
MRFTEHIVLGGIAGAGLSPILGMNSIWFWLASVFIDLDHYMDYIYRTGFRDFSPRRMFGYHYYLEGCWQRPEFLNIEIFHTIEFIAPLLVYSYMTQSPVLTAIVLGLIFHIGLDMTRFYSYKAFFIRANSVIEYFIRARTLKKQGLDPALLFKEAARL